ncbi:hypothetical protein Trydic_g15698 [Trypoxylus dichotomus]
MPSKLYNFRRFTHDLRKSMELIPSIQSYDWGKYDFTIEPHKPYAELWMGTHVNGPSFVKHLERSLFDIVMEQPGYLGSTVQNKFGNNLPYLLKVLSIQKALSIQVHPSKSHAEKLHAEQPQIYKDPNHKPELAIALTPFEALCGFRPLTEIANFFRIIPELGELIGDDLCKQFINESSEDLLKQCFCNLMMCPEENIKKAFAKIFQRFTSLGNCDRDAQLVNLVERLYKQFPDDVGCFVVYFLNYLQLEPLQAIYLGANLPHAYLSGDCVECMACSDNVVRAGLTPKFKDVNTLCAMLNYQGEAASAKIFKPFSENEYTEVFRPPVPDFAIAKIQVSGGVKELGLIIRDSGSILLMISGTAMAGDTELFSGVSIFLPAGKSLKLQNVSKNFLAFQAMANV